MPKFIRRARVARPVTPLASGPSAVALDEGSSRKAFLQGSAGAALALATPKVATLALDGPAPAVAAEPRAVPTAPSTRPPREPVTAFVRDAERGEVTVLAGTNETTYRDPVLVKRMLDAAR